MKNISVKCDACGAEFMVPSSLAGQKARCSCGASLSIPKSDETDDDKTPESEEKKETPQTETSLESARWYVSESGQSKGPLSFEELKNRVVHGQLLPQDQVYAEPLGGWKPIAEIDALKPGKQKQKDAWYVSIKGQRYGPYKTEYVKELIQKGQITPKTSVWSKELGDWRTIRQVGRFQQTLKELEASKNIEEMWYWMRKGKREGPYSLENLLKAVRKGKIKADDRIWSNKLDGWKDAASIPELSEALDEVPSAASAASGELWYYRHNGEVEGPLEFNELCQLVERKQVVAGDTVFNKKLGTWKDIRDVPELEKSIAAAESGLGKADEESEQWYFRMEGQERGPVTERYLAELLAKRKLGPDDKIQGPDSDQWRPIRNVPAIARYADFSAPSTTRKPDEQPTGTVTGTIIAQGRKESDRWKKIGIGLVILLVLGSGGLFLVTSLRNRGNGGNTKNGGFQTSTNPKQFIKQWLTFFLPELEGGAAGQQQEIGRKLKLFYNGNFMDAFGRDVRARLRNHLMGSDGINLSDLKIVELKTHELLRAEDEQNFCFIKGPVEKQEFEVKTGVPEEKAGAAGTKVKKTFSLEDFSPVRCFELRSNSTGKPLHRSARVIIGKTGEKLSLYALGRLGHVGAFAGNRQIRYVTGYKAPSMYEADCLLRLGTEEKPGASGKEWLQFGELMSVDSDLVSPAVIECRLEAETTGIDVPDLVVRLKTGLRRVDIVQRYGTPPETEKVNLKSTYYEVVLAEKGSSPRLVSYLRAMKYGKFAPAVDPISAEVLGFLIEDLETGL